MKVWYYSTYSVMHERRIHIATLFEKIMMLLLLIETIFGKTETLDEKKANSKFNSRNSLT